MKIIGVIPARYKSSRFPGKPLADICGKPMIWWVYQQCKKVEDFDEVYVATDDGKIFSVCESLGVKVIMTLDTHKTGTDRIGEVARKIPADLIVNIQGDEPLLEPGTIKAAIEPFYTNPQIQISNLMTKIKDPVDTVNFTVPKVITNREGVGIYLTRATAPYPKQNIFLSPTCSINSSKKQLINLIFILFFKYNSSIGTFPAQQIYISFPLKSHLYLLKSHIAPYYLYIVLY